MGRIIYILAFCVVMAVAGCKKNGGGTFIGPESIERTMARIAAADPSVMERGVRQAAALWRAEDGTPEEFEEFCVKNYIDDPAQRKAAFERISFYMEGLYGHFNQMALRLRWNTDLDSGPLLPIDESFAAFTPSAHLSDDLYANKIAFVVALNFPEVPLGEKETLGTDRQAWAYARMGDIFTERIPADVLQKAARAESDADLYIARYNIAMGHLLTDDGRRIFPEDMMLLSHWNLRDEIKSNYGAVEGGLEKQRMIYKVMERIVAQDIPAAAVDSREYDWNPFTNAVTQGGKPVELAPEGAERYRRILANFHAMQAIDRHTGDTWIDRKFDDDMEIGVEAARELFDSYMSAQELKAVGEIIAERLGRPLEPYDIWYDGFKARSTLNTDDLSARIEEVYPTAAAFESGIPDILVKYGFAPDRAREIGSKIAVDAARGSGHAWGAAMKGQKSHLRTRLTPRGMDYKGYNIAIHELGHNVEQTVSLYDVDNYVMNGVPNTSFTEALAFLFQKRDLALLGIDSRTPDRERLEVLDKAWALFEICGVSMLDISVWEWLYANPQATAEQLRDQTLVLAKETWNKYYAPVFGIHDQTVLAIYSHMVAHPLYLSAYAFGQIIEFQLERYLEGRDFAAEIDRIYRLGRLTPNAWMQQAAGSPVSADPMLAALRSAINR